MQPRRILVRLPTWVGDAVMATPALRALRAAHPRAEIALEGRPAVGALLDGLASFDRFLADPAAQDHAHAQGAGGPSAQPARQARERSRGARASAQASR